MPPSISFWDDSGIRPESTRRVILPVSTTEAKVNIMFMACGQITLRPNTFHKAIIINGNPGNAPLLNSTLLKSPVIAHL